MPGNKRSAFTQLLPVLWAALLTGYVVKGGSDFYLHASSSHDHHVTMKRSHSLSGTSVRLRGGDSLHLTFCLRQRTTVQVQTVVYSNDGKSENVAVVMDGTYLGTFPTHGHSDWGHMWNVFFATRPFPRALDLPAGWHGLRLGVLLPSDGVEIDSVRVWFSDSRLTRPMVECQLFCRTSLPVVPTNNAVLPQMAEVRQASYPTKCAEEDNVKVPLYLPDISEYTITATMPTYTSFANRRDANTTGCPYLSPLHWTFKGVAIPSTGPVSRVSGSANLLLLRGGGGGGGGGSNTASGGYSQVLRIEFALRGQAEGYVDADMGSTLTLIIRKSSTWVIVRIAYMGRSGSLQSVRNVVFAPGQTKGHVTFPDFTWRERATNVVLLEVRSRDPVLVEEAKLERRPMKGETVHTVYRSGRVVVEAVEVDFWWRRPETMQLINGETGQKWVKVDFFRIYLTVPWNGGYSQVFVMYQDGNVRLAPLPPPGLDWIPFGSSVIVGHADPSLHRPAAPVSSVTFHPSSLLLHIQYRDNSTAKVALTSSQTETMATVYDLNFSVKDTEAFPFATLRSMYIEDGNSDCDGLMVDGKSYHHLMDRWGSLQGKSFFFFRRCESTHLTLSPDVRIDVKRVKVNGANGASQGSSSDLASNSWWRRPHNSQGIARKP